MINRLIPLVSSALPLFPYVLNYIIGLAFLATVPVMIRYLLRR